MGEEGLNRADLFFAHVEAFDSEAERFASGEESEGDGFAVDGGDRGHADIDGASARGEIDAPVLGESAFGDVHVGHDFQSRNDGTLQDSKLWWDSDFVENAIDAIANPQIIFEGFDVDIGGAFHDGFADDLVDEFDHAGLGIIVGDVFGFVLVIGAVGSGGGEDFVEGFGTDTVDGFDGAKEESAGDDDPIDFAVGELLGGEASGHGIKDIEGGEPDSGSGYGNGENVVFENEARGEELEGGAFDFGGIDDFAGGFEEAREGGGEGLFVDFSGIESEGGPASAGGWLEGGEGVGVVGGEASVEEESSENFAGSHPRRGKSERLRGDGFFARGRGGVAERHGRFTERGFGEDFLAFDIGVDGGLHIWGNVEEFHFALAEVDGVSGSPSDDGADEDDEFVADFFFGGVAEEEAEDGDIAEERDPRFGAIGGSFDEATEDERGFIGDSHGSTDIAGGDGGNVVIIDAGEA